MIKYAAKKRYILPDETMEENEKYYMRVWLVRLGLEGAEGKRVRKVMLKNLKGHTSFRTKADRERWREAHGLK